MSGSSVRHSDTLYSPETLSTGMPEEWAGIHTFYPVSSGVSVGCFNGKPGIDWCVSGKASPGFGIAVVLEGECQMALDGGVPLVIRSGMAILHSTRQVVGGWDEFKGQQSIRVVDVRFSQEAVTQLCGQAAPQLQGRLLQDSSMPGEEAYLGTLPAWSGIARVASEVLRFPHHDRMSSRLFMQAKAMEALALTVQRLADQGNPGSSVTAFDRRRVQQVYHWIQQYVAVPATVRQLAQQAGLSEKRLQAGFMALYGQSVHDCIQQARMETAANLLRQGQSVTDVAMSVGFSSLSHFIKIFKNYWGATPKSWLGQTE